MNTLELNRAPQPQESLAAYIRRVRASVTIMPSVQETAYPRLKSNITLRELTAIYTPTTEEIGFAQQSTASGSSTRLGFLILLKTFQRLGYAVQTQAVPASIIRHIATAANLTVSQRELAHYDAAVTRRRHLSLIRDYLHLHAYSPTAKTVMEEAIRTAAATKQDLADLINVAIEELVRQRFELPAFSTLTRTAQQIRAQVTTTFYRAVNHRLNPASRQQLDALLTIAPDATMTSWHDLKQDAGRPTLTHLQAWIDRLQQLNQLQVNKTAQFLWEHRNNRGVNLSTIAIENAGTESETRAQRLDLSWIPAKWWYLVMGQRARVPMPESVNRRHFEVCIYYSW